MSGEAASWGHGGGWQDREGSSPPAAPWQPKTLGPPQERLGGLLDVRVRAGSTTETGPRRLLPESGL